MDMQILLGAVVLALAPSSQIAETASSLPASLTCPLDRPYAENNPFARILRGKLPSSKVYEDDEVIVIMPLEWEHPGHALVIPKVPVRSLLDMTPAQMGPALDVGERAWRNRGGLGPQASPSRRTTGAIKTSVTSISTSFRTRLPSRAHPCRERNSTEWPSVVGMSFRENRLGS